jgi:hypothetical protein
VHQSQSEGPASRIESNTSIDRGSSGEAAEEGLDVATAADTSTKFRQVTMRAKIGRGT